MTETEKTSEELVKESKELRKVMMVFEVKEAGPWRSDAEVELWIQDYYEMVDQGITDPAASEVANVRESIRLSAKVDASLVEHAANHCVARKMDLYGCSEEDAKHRCAVEFKVCFDQRGEKAYEARSLADLDELYCKLNSEISRFRYDAMRPVTPEQAEILARRKLGLPQIVTLTKSEEKNNRVFLDRVPEMYGKSSEQILRERREHG